MFNDNDLDDGDDLFNDSPVLDENPPVIEDESILEEPLFEPSPQSDILSDLLKAQGINDGKILIVNDNNEEEELDFYSLSKEEQLDILLQKEEPENVDLDDSEIDLINSIRESGKSVEEFLAGIPQSVEPTVSYEIDNYTDQELFAIDLRNKYDLTDEELIKELEKELQDEVLFKKKADKLREEYKQIEDQYKQEEQIKFEQERQENYNNFVNVMADVAVKTPELYNFELTEDERDNTLRFILDLDDNGQSEFYKMLNDPKKLYEAAWFLNYGKEAFDSIQSAYEAEIARLKQPDKPRVATRKPTQANPTINDLY